MNNPAPLPNSHRSHHGFTLVELLVATTVSIMLIGLMLGVTQGLLGSYQDIRNRIIKQGDASLAIDQIILDLEGMVVPNAPNTEALKSTPETVNGTPTTWLTFLTTATDEDPTDHTGATRGVSYRLAHQNAIDGSDTSPSYILMRSLSSAKQAFEHLMGNQDHQNNYWDDLPETPEPAPKDPIAPGCFLAGNLVEFEIRFQKSLDDTWTLPTDEVRISNSGIFVNGTRLDDGFHAVEVTMTTISPSDAELLSNGAIDRQTAIRRSGQSVIRQTASFLGGQ